MYNNKLQGLPHGSMSTLKLSKHMEIIQNMIYHERWWEIFQEYQQKAGNIAIYPQNRKRDNMIYRSYKKRLNN